MQWYESAVAALEACIRNGAIPPNVNLFYGSSSFRLWETLADDLSPHAVANAAFGGSTLEACVHFFERLVVPARPKTLFFYAGDNDLGDGKYYLQVIEYFEALLSKRARYLPETPLYFLSIKPSPARRHLIPMMRLVNAYARDRLAEMPGCVYSCP
ncbi:MAG: GDSL family lipase [Campylobacterales bacterium]|nr:GDSL family lipase [Campylobacterales bacterium]